MPENAEPTLASLIGASDEMYEQFRQFIRDRLSTIGEADLPSDLDGLSLSQLEGDRGADGSRDCGCGEACHAKSLVSDAVRDLIAGRAGELAGYLHLVGEAVVVGTELPDGPLLALPVIDAQDRRFAVITAPADSLPPDWQAALTHSAQEGTTS